MTREEKEQTGKYVLQMARLLEEGCYQQEMLLKAVRIIDEALEKEPATMKYRKKPVVVEAYQTDKEMIIHTLEGDMRASVGDYIITGVNGEQYPCKPDIFEKTYEKIEENNGEEDDRKVIELRRAFNQGYDIGFKEGKENKNAK